MNMKSIFKKLHTATRGQAILLIAFAMVGLVAFVGLMTDGGILLIEYGKLKRGIDAAAIASSQQFRRGFNGADLATAARNFLILNESDSSLINIYRCKEDQSVVDGTIHDADLCTTPARKLVRVEATRTVNFGFLRVVGINSYDITATSVGEAASIDLVLVIDTSTSMAYDTYVGGTSGLDVIDDSEDPAICNYSVSTPCEPLATVKDVALEFLDTMYFPYDRVAVVAFTSQTPGGTRAHTTVLGLSEIQADVIAAISSLKVFEPSVCDLTVSPGAPSDGPCRNVPSGTFIGYDCPRFRDTNDLSSCNSSNIGGAMTRAWSEFSTASVVRADALWITILLAGGPANATDGDGSTIPAAGVAPPSNEFPFGYCPVLSPPCRDGSGSSRHSAGDSDYDADDYARDKADAVANPVSGGGITTYTIGLGNLIRNATIGDPDGAEQLLEYIANDAGDPPGCTGDTCASHGFYSYAPNTSQLAAIFASIAENIFTKIAK
jgi:hypothetical protein